MVTIGASGTPPPLKNPLSSDPEGIHIVRHKALDLRPLADKTTGIKTIGAVARTCLAGTTVAYSQNRFVAGRQLVQNVLHMDTGARIHAMRCMHNRNATRVDCMLSTHSVGNRAAVVLFDFVTALPSTSHQIISGCSRCLSVLVPQQGSQRLCAAYTLRCLPSFNKRGT